MKKRPARQLSIIGHNNIILDGRTVSYILKQSARIQGIRLEIHGDTGLIVVVPRKYSPAKVTEILQKKSKWILRHLPENKPFQMPLFSKEIDHGERIRYMDKWLKIVISSDGHGKASASLKDNTLFICCGDRQANRSKILESWYRQQAYNIFKQKADTFKTAMGLNYRRIVIRGQRKRWASASPVGNLSINWKLLLAPEAVVDYVIMHELAHLKHMNHSKKFWEFLSLYCPKWKEHRKWLIRHEDELKREASFTR